MKDTAGPEALSITLLLDVIINFIFFIILENNKDIIYSTRTYIILCGIILILFSILTFIISYFCFFVTLSNNESSEIVKNKLSTESYTEVELTKLDFYVTLIENLFNTFDVKLTAIKDSEDEEHVLIYIELKDTKGNLIYYGIFEELYGTSFDSYYKIKEE